MTRPKRSKKYTEKHKDMCVLAPPKGLEPLTDWLTASRSTWLSYGGKPLLMQLSVSQRYLRLVITALTLKLSVELCVWQYPRNPCKMNAETVHTICW